MLVSEKISLADLMDSIIRNNPKEKVDALIKFLSMDNWQDCSDGVGLKIVGYSK